MILLDYPFVSDYLIQTIKKNNFMVVATREARALIPETIISWVTEKDASRLIHAHPETPLYTNSENALNWLERHAGDSVFVKHAQLFKDKARFRELIQARYPDFSFKTIKLEDKPRIGSCGYPSAPVFIFVHKGHP